MSKISKNIITKWQPVIESMFSIKNKELTDHICNFSEWRSSLNDNELVEKLRVIKEIIYGHDFRVEIVGEYYNSLTSLVEYKLIDGTFINKNELNSYTLSDNEVLNIFGAEYLKYYDLVKYRDIVINDIVN